MNTKFTTHDSQLTWQISARSWTAAVLCRFSIDHAEFANSADDLAEMVAFVNDITVDHAGWAQLAPFGDYPGQAMLRQPDGSIARFPAIQRLDRAAADTMTARFKSPWHRMKRYFTGCPYLRRAHPDVPAFASDYPDKTPKGMIVDLQVRPDGLYCKPVFTNEGSELVETKKLRAFSAYWSAREVGEQTGADGQPLKIYRPDHLKSAGLTNHPNLPVHLLNEQSATARQTPQNTDAASPSSGGEGEGERQLIFSSSNQRQPVPIMKKQIVIDFLAAQGITLANEATDDQIAAALQQCGDRTTAAETILATRSLEMETLNSELANERKFHRDTLLDNALALRPVASPPRNVPNGPVASKQTSPMNPPR